MYLTPIRMGVVFWSGQHSLVSIFLQSWPIFEVKVNRCFSVFYLREQEEAAAFLLYVYCFASVPGVIPGDLPFHGGSL